MEDELKDLIELNRRILAHALGRKPNEREDAYLQYLPVCLGRFLPGIEDIRRAISGVRPRHENALPVMYVNRDYLNHARLSSLRALAGATEKFIELGINFEMATVLSQLANDEVTRLALHWDGLLVAADLDSLRSGMALHANAGKFHAAAHFLAA